jgi:hypothetical protein
VAGPAASATGSLLGGFEGSLTFAVKGELAGPGKANPTGLELGVLVKENRVRVDPPAGLLPGKDSGRVFVLFEVDQKKVHLVLADRKQAFLLDLDKVGPDLEALQQARPKGTSGDAGAEASIKETGKKDRVAGYECTIWEVAHGEGKTELCMKTESALKLDLPSLPLPPELSFVAKLADGRKLPLRVISFKKGTEAGRVEFKKLERKALPASDFEVPRGFVIVTVDQKMLSSLSSLGALAGSGAAPMPGLGGRAGLRGLPAIPGLPSGFALPTNRPPKASPSTKP